MRFWNVLLLSLFYALTAGMLISHACGFFHGRGLRRASCVDGPSDLQVAPVSCANCAAAGGAKEDCGCCPSCQCGDACLCSVKGPCCDSCRCQLRQSAPAVDPVQHPGVMQGEMGKRGEWFWLNGRSATRQDVIRAFASTVPDDRKELSLTFIGGTDAERAAAVKMAKEMGLGESTLIQSYDADNPIVKRGGFVAPAIYLQDPSGKVLMRAATMDRAALESMSATVKVYDPSKDPTPDNFSLESLKKLVADVPLWAWLALAFLVLLYLDKKGKL